MTLFDDVLQHHSKASDSIRQDEAAVSNSCAVNAINNNIVREGSAPGSCSRAPPSKMPEEAQIEGMGRLRLPDKRQVPRCWSMITKSELAST